MSFWPNRLSKKNKNKRIAIEFICSSLFDLNGCVKISFGFTVHYGQPKEKLVNIGHVLCEYTHEYHLNKIYSYILQFDLLMCTATPHKLYNLGKFGEHTFKAVSSSIGYL